MKKSLISSSLTLCAILLIAAVCVQSALCVASLTNFRQSRTYSNSFSDVSEDAWYFEYIKAAYEYDIIDGTSSGVFKPYDKITVAESIKLAAVLHNGYFGGSEQFEQSEPWYRTYVDYALENDIIPGEYKNYDAAASRADFAQILAYALPDEAVTVINNIPDGAIPDVSEGFAYGSSVYKLYRAGVLTGFDSAGTFYPGKPVLRAEAAAAAVRLIDTDTRVELSLSYNIPAEVLFAKCSPAVFFLEIFDEDGDLVKTGSGFFISDSGLAVTNDHVVVGAQSAKITTQDGETYDVLGIYDYNRVNDISLLQIDGDGFPYLDTADSDSVLTGASIYTIGSPLGLHNSFSTGVISAVSRFFDGAEYIQIDAVISSGSSGGALLNASGKVIGITSAAVDGGQSLNLAVPINLVDDLLRDDWVPLDSIIPETENYPDYPVPDFGAYFGLETYKEGQEEQETWFSYLVSDMSGDPEEMLSDFAYVLEQKLFSSFGSYVMDGYTFSAYYHVKHNIFVLLGIEDLDGEECVTLIIS